MDGEHGALAAGLEAEAADAQRFDAGRQGALGRSGWSQVTSEDAVTSCAHLPASHPVT